MPYFDEDDDTIDYQVVVNGEEQYSLWPTDLRMPDGWRPAGFTGRIGPCLDHIERTWTDMRPLSARSGADG
ncbi:MbtH family protein [Allonocardiopsis opalescens]|uniref:MbtH family protein n=1 Tax=Allonocardiopsis opalescens TaxID=1144618 RepID=UPI000D081321|nr:MbtH family protein [Allonocardiopsis opalescens]